VTFATAQSGARAPMKSCDIGNSWVCGS